IVPMGGIWANGSFNVPIAVSDKYIKLASEYQLKALLIILGSNGRSSSEEISKRLGITVSDAEEIMEFWIEEGVAFAEGMEIKTAPVSEKKEEEIKEEKKKIQITAPTLTPKDIVDAVQENEEIAGLLNEAQVVLGRTLSHNEREMLVNMIDFYGMKSEIVLMILQYWRSVNEKENSRAKGIAYVLKIAQNWLDDGIDTIEAAEEKLMQLEKSNRIWKEIAALAGIEHKKPTIKQGEMVLAWSNDFSFDMISAAIEQMKENTPAPSLPYVDKILKSWKKKGIQNLADVENESKEFEKSKAEKQTKSYYQKDRVQGTPSFDLDEIMKNALKNTEIKY
ncbi:MAG: DnaD domain protein, partial [Eubacterium sp.]|nr:DnaD domain protein [Eubacterium sp.]